MKLILAADENWGIGKAGTLCWNIPGDMAWFRSKTKGKTVISGRKTIESIPGGKGLPNRRNIVLTRNPDYTYGNAEIYNTIEEVLEAVKDQNQDDVYVIGGGEIYRQFLPYCDTCYITKVQGDFGCDSFFVDIDADENFERKPLSEEKEENGIRYRFFEYNRI